jgi:hypothetical protein
MGIVRGQRDAKVEALLENLLVGMGAILWRLSAFSEHARTYRANIRNPALSPATVMCPLQGALPSTRTTSPGLNCLLSPSVVVIENLPRRIVANSAAGPGWLSRFSKSRLPQTGSKPPKHATDAGTLRCRRELLAARYRSC